MEDITNYYNFYINNLINERDNTINYIQIIMDKYNYNNLPTLYNHKLKIMYELIIKENNNQPYVIDKEIVKNMIKNSIKITLQDFKYITINIQFNISNIEIKKDYISLNFEIFKPIIAKNNIYIFEHMLDIYKKNDIKIYIEMFNFAYPQLKSTSSLILKEMTKLNH